MSSQPRLLEQEDHYNMKCFGSYEASAGEHWSLASIITNRETLAQTPLPLFDRGAYFTDNEMVYGVHMWAQTLHVCIQIQTHELKFMFLGWVWMCVWELGTLGSEGEEAGGLWVSAHAQCGHWVQLWSTEKRGVVEEEGKGQRGHGERLYVCMNTCACECEYECVYQGEWETDCLTRDTESLYICVCV